MAEGKDSTDCCHCVNIENASIGKYFKAKRITDDCTKEDGKKSYKLQWEETWTEEEDLENCIDLLEQYTKNGKPQIELLAQAENTDDDSHVFVLKVSKTAVNTDGDLSVHGFQGHALIDKMTELSKEPKQLSTDPFQEDVKMVTYAQLQKAGFLVDEEDATETDAQQNQPQSQNQMQQQPPQQQFSGIDVVEDAKQQMYSQIAGNSMDNNMKFLHYVHNDIESSKVRRNYAPRRRQPFQLYKCDTCGSEFVHRTHLKIHQRTHTGEKPYKCEFCGRCFAQKGNLHVHMKIHTGEKDFLCEYCQRGFITNAQLFVHMRTHTNPNRKRPYATGRPSKNAPPTKNGSVSAETPNQIIVQLVQDDDDQSNGKQDEVDSKDQELELQDTSGMQNLTAGTRQVDNLSVVAGQSEATTYNMQPVAEGNLNTISDNGDNMV